MFKWIVYLWVLRWICKLSEFNKIIFLFIKCLVYWENIINVSLFKWYIYVKNYIL